VPTPKFDAIEQVGTIPYADNGEQVIELPDLPTQGLLLGVEGTYNAGAVPAGTVLTHAASRLISDVIVEMNGREPIHIQGDALASLHPVWFAVPVQETNPANAASGETVNSLLYIPIANEGDVVPLGKIPSKSLRIRFGNGVAAMVSGAASDASLTVSKVAVYALVRHLPPAQLADLVSPIKYLYAFTRTLQSSMSHETIPFGEFKAVQALHLLYRESGNLTAFSGKLTRFSVREAARALTGEIGDFEARAFSQYLFGGNVDSHHAPIIFSAFGGGWIRQKQGTHAVDISGGSLVVDTASGLTSPSLTIVAEGIVPISDARGTFYDTNQLPDRAFQSVPGDTSDYVPSLKIPESVQIIPDFGPVRTGVVLRGYRRVRSAI